MHRPQKTSPLLKWNPPIQAKRWTQTNKLACKRWRFLSPHYVELASFLSKIPTPSSFFVFAWTSEYSCEGNRLSQISDSGPKADVTVIRIWSFKYFSCASKINPFTQNQKNSPENKRYEMNPRQLLELKCYLPQPICVRFSSSRESKKIYLYLSEPRYHWYPKQIWESKI